MQADAELAGRIHLSGGDDGVDLGVGDHGRQMLGGKIGRAQDEPPRDAVELDQGERGGELIAGRDQDRTPGELGETAAEAGAVHQIGQGDADVEAMQMAAAIGRREPVAQGLKLVSSCEHDLVRGFRVATTNRQAARFIDLDEVAERHREGDVVGHREGIEPELVLEPRHQDREAQQVEAGVEQHQIVGQRRKPLRLLVGDSLHLRHYR